MLLPLVVVNFLLDGFSDTMTFVDLIDWGRLLTLDTELLLLLVVEFLLDEKNFFTLERVFLRITEVGWVWLICVDGCEGLDEEIDTVAIKS